MTRVCMFALVLLAACSFDVTAPVDCPAGETEWGWSYLDTTGVLYKTGGCASFAVMDSIMAACLTGQCIPTDTIVVGK